jgi:hypothetical protein
MKRSGRTSRERGTSSETRMDSALEFNGAGTKMRSIRTPLCVAEQMEQECVGVFVAEG